MLIKMKLHTLHFLTCTFLFVLASSTSWAQNSTEKIRSTPSELALSVGTKVEWRTDLKTAISHATKAKKPIFWYVTTLQGSFMDRQPEVDRYMMGGPFSWPAMVRLLNEDYIPLRLPADRKLRKKYNLAPVEFIEPGILILSSKGKEKSRVDRVTTLHPGWFQAQFNGQIDEISNFPGFLDQTINELFYRSLPTAELGRDKFEEALAQLEGDQKADAMWLFAAGMHDQRNETEARKVLMNLKNQFPEHPLGAKAALELEGHGPYWRGFESYDDIPEQALTANSSGTLAMVGTFSADEIEQRSIAFLVRTQSEDGAWRDSIYDFGGTDSMPNVYAAVTAINARGLIGKEHASEALSRALKYLSSDDILNLEDLDELIWAYLYRIRLYCALLGEESGSNESISKLLQHNVDAMVAMQVKNGSWFHEYQNPFVTASCLIALSDATKHGAVVEDLEDIVERGLIPLEKSRSKKGAYSYYIGNRSSSLEGSVGRTPVGELARHFWGVSKKKDLGNAIGNSIRHQEPLFLARKYDDHTDMHAYGGFFFWYSMLGRTEAIVALPKGKLRTKYSAQQRDLILALPEIDGVFIDSHELGRSYGTGMALWCLDLLDETD
ncbi:MAG: hypothetical protein COA70_00895 [Planctomycetota bacterium]|nr:MAG: hypothetical protein COA70_00895 [Planctomycetota bacterium]